jgi:hypothetical protein
MAERATQRHWLIRGFDGHTKIDEKRIDLGQLSEKQLKPILKALATWISTRSLERTPPGERR